MNAEATPRKFSALLLKWGRRLTAMWLFGSICFWAAGGSSPGAQLERLLGQVPLDAAMLPIGRVLVISAVLWYAYLSQLKVRWALWLPFYFLLFPFWLLLTLGLRLFAAPLGAFVNSLAGAEETLSVPVATPTSNTPATSQSQPFPVKRLWLLLFFIWFVALRGLGLSWANWIPPVLTAPVWHS
jgi:hypothetical protein